MTRQTLTAHPAGSPAAESAALDARIEAAVEARRIMDAMDTRDLLRVAFRLTHQMHDAKGQAERDLRNQRDAIEAAILRRTGDA